MNGFRRPAVAGLFYPSLASELNSLLDSYLTECDTTVSETGGIVAPHAGYLYSGAAAGEVYASLPKGMYKTVIILSPSHREYFRGCSVFPGDGYLSPLGEVPIDKALRDKMVTLSPESIFLSEAGHRKEHAVEVNIPFIQKQFPKASILPLVMGDQSSAAIDNLARVLAEVYTEDTLIVASSDLSHFYSAEVASVKDSRFAELFEAGDDIALETELASEKTEACGGGLVVAMMRALHQHSLMKGKTIKLTHSGVVSGDYSEVVGYLSAKMV